MLNAKDAAAEERESAKTLKSFWRTIEMFKRFSTVVCLCLLTLVKAAELQRVVIDGRPTDAFWQQIRSGNLVPTEARDPAEVGGEVRAAIASGYLYLSARMTEPGGLVTARSIGRNPIWEGGGEARAITEVRQYSNGAPEGEDYVRFFIRVYNENDWMLQVGPLGAYAVKWRWTGEQEWYASRPDKCDRFLVAAQIGENDWSVEAAIPLDQIGSPQTGYVRLRVERNRAERPGMPREQWRWPEQEPTSEVAVFSTDSPNLRDPIFRPPVLGNQDPPMEVGFKKELPPLDSDWTAPVWRETPTWALFRNEVSARLPVFPTEVKLLHDGRTLAVLARCIEPDRVVARARDVEDSSVAEDDTFGVYLAISGSTYMHYAINPTGFVLAETGHTGNPRLSRPFAIGKGGVRGTARQEAGQWIGRLDLPLREIAESLGEGAIPQEWRLLLLRFRPARDGEPREISVLPITQSVTPLCPARYRRFKLVDVAPSLLRAHPIPERSPNLASFPAQVLTPEQRKQLDLAGMLEQNIRNRVFKILEAEKQEWDRVKTLADWEHFREPRLKALATSLGTFPDRGPLETRVTSEFQGVGYRRQNLVYQSRPGLWVTANLYLPAERMKQMPGIIIVHSHHAPKTQFELQDMGIIWARAGCAVLVMDQVGFGERIQTYPWDREAHNSSHIVGMQLQVASENLMNWIVWDTIRGLDLLLQRGDVDEKQIILLGAVAGGGDPAGLTAALDPRIAAVAPFNFGESEPEELRSDPKKNQWPLDLADPGWGDMVSTGALRGAIRDQYFPWTICASIAPRRFIYSYELGWNVEDLPAWARYRKVFGFYDVLDHLADAHGYGPFPGPGECWNIGPAQRRSLYPTLERWFGIPTPFAEAKRSLQANLERRPSVDQQPVSELAALTPAVASELHMRSIHELAREQGLRKLEVARAELEKLTPSSRRQWVKTQWGKKLGDIEPNPHAGVTVQWTKQTPNGQVEGITLTVEPGIVVPILLLRPHRSAVEKAPVVVAVAEGGKDLFLAERSQEIEAILKGGMAVCLADVRGTGETSPDPKLDPDGDEIREHLAANELMLGDTLLGKRLKDLRTVIAYLERRRDMDAERIGLWGDSFAPANPAHLLIDEQLQWQIGPKIEEQAEPLGGLLAILGGLYEDGVRVIAVRGGLASYLSVCDDYFVYIPADVIVPRILEAGDIADVAAALAPRPLLIESLVDARDRLLPDAELQSKFSSLRQAYQGMSQSKLVIRNGAALTNLAEWFRTGL
jgi:cephalosporin-C deacetylase-like acetyl esterase